MRGRAALVAIALWTSPARAQDSIRIRDAGPGLSGRIIQDALLAPYVVLWNGTDTLSLARGRSYSTTVIVLAHHVTVSSAVSGDVIVVGGDAFVHPGATVSGRVIAIGGGAYPSTLGRVVGGVASFRGETFVVSRIGGAWQLDYRAVTDDADGISWQGTLGLQTPTYDRSDGLSLPVSPQVRLDSGAVALDPAVTYRSHLGAIDPSMTGLFQPTRRTTLRGAVERGTFSNDGWIMSDLANSLSAVGDGADSRNWYRADRGTASIDHLWDGVHWSSDWRLGGLVERDWSVGPDSGTQREPWSIVDHRSVQGMLRLNPPVAHGTISSVRAGAVVRWAGVGVSAAMSADLEASLHSPTSEPTPAGPASTEFVQGTLNGFLTVPTVGAQRYHLEVHAVATEGSAPPQRWAYLGGTGTLGTLHMLQFGGDQLFLADSRYEIPISTVSVPLVGTPVLALRHVIGSAGFGHIGTLSQLVGVRLTLAPVEGDLLMDTTKRRLQGSLGWSFVR